VKVDVLHGWPHTFWLKAPQLERALEPEMDMIKGLKWLLKNEQVVQYEEKELRWVDR